MQGPDPNKSYPFEGLPYKLNNIKRVVFLKNIVKRKNVIIGNYTYFDDSSGSENFEDKNVLYHYDFSKEKLIIKNFTAIAEDVKFIMSSANHRLSGLSTYPFGIFGYGWEKVDDLTSLNSKGDTVIGNDVWLGYGSVILPGVRVEMVQ